MVPGVTRMRKPRRSPIPVSCTSRGTRPQASRRVLSARVRLAPSLASLPAAGLTQSSRTVAALHCCWKYSPVGRGTLTGVICRSERPAAAAAALEEIPAPAVGAVPSGCDACLAHAWSRQAARASAASARPQEPLPRGRFSLQCACCALASAAGMPQT